MDLGLQVHLEPPGGGPFEHADRVEDQRERPRAGRQAPGCDGELQVEHDEREVLGYAVEAVRQEDRGLPDGLGQQQWVT